MKKIRIQLHLSSKDQKELNYQNPNLVWDFDDLMGYSFEGTLDRTQIIKNIRDDLSIPCCYLEDYQIVKNDNTILVMK